LAEGAADLGIVDRSHRQGQGKAEQVKSVVSEIVAELKAIHEQERAGHRRLYELNTNYEATPEEFTMVLDDAYSQRMQAATKILALRFKMQKLMTVEEWKALSDQMLAYIGRYRHSESAPRTGY